MLYICQYNWDVYIIGISGFLFLYMWTTIHYIIMFHICLYVVCIHLVIKDKLLHTFVPTIQNIINFGLLKVLLYLMRVSEAWWLEWLQNFIPLSIWTSHKCFVKFLLVFDCKSTFQLIYVIYILFGFNHISMVIPHPYNGLGLWFPYISNRTIISCEYLLHLYT